jgi:cellobiose epimerase
MTATVASRLRALHQEMRQHLERGIIPFWLARAQDKKFGGFLTNFDGQGRPLHTPEKYLNTQCRLIWWFSHLARRFPHVRGCRSRARQGVAFLLRHFWDPRFGGWYWKVKRDGAPFDMAKIVYGQSFAIYALAEYTLGTGDRRGQEFASRTFDLLQKHCADTLNGGYYENLRRDWALEKSGFAGGDRKSLDTHMHLMESFTTLYEISGHALHRRKLLEITALIVRHMIDLINGCGLNQFDWAWNPIPAIAVKRTWNAERYGRRTSQIQETTSYGHNLELVWLIHRALMIAHANVKAFNDCLIKLVDHALLHGMDWKYGGIYRDGLRTGGTLVREKEFWQQAESLVGLLDAYQVFGSKRCLDAFQKTWRFVCQRMVVQSVGEWRTLLDREGNPLDANIGNPWKVSYHTGRAMCECCTRLEQLSAPKKLLKRYRQ